MVSRPDVLVLGAGGVLGEAWLTGVLAGIEDSTGFDLSQCEYFVGTSAGSIVAATLVAGRPLRRPPETGHDLELPATKAAEGLSAASVEAARRAGAWALAAASAFAPLALGIAAPGGAFVRGALLRRLPRPGQTLGHLRSQIDRSGARFDGRLRIVAVERSSGRRVVFGSPGAPHATVSKAVEASCTVPWLFAPVEIDGHEYVDGGVWSPTNLDAAPAARDTQVLCLVPTASIAGTNALLALLRNAARSAVALEAMAVRRRGAAVQTVVPNPDSAVAMGVNLMDRGPGEQVLAAGYQQGLELATAP